MLNANLVSELHFQSSKAVEHGVGNFLAIVAEIDKAPVTAFRCASLEVTSLSS